MLDIEYIQDQMQLLVDEKKALINKEKRLMRRFDASEWHNLQSQFNEMEEMRNEIHDKLANYDRQKLHKSLLYLDYSSHMDLFDEYRNVCRTAAFLLHGSGSAENSYGHSVHALLQRLILEIPNGSVTPLLTPDFSTAMSIKDIPGLWDYLANKVILPTNATREEIIMHFCNRLKSENIIFVFRGIEYLPVLHLEKIISDFWKPLADAAHAQGSQYFFLMFLIDLQGR